MLSQTSLHALRALAHMVEHRDEEPILSREIGESTDIPANYLSKIMHALGAAGVLTAVRGKNGGYRFAQDPSRTRIVDIVNLFQNTEQFRVCLLGNQRCSDDKPCLIHERWKPASEAMFKFLDETSLADLRAPDIP